MVELRGMRADGAMVNNQIGVLERNTIRELCRWITGDVLEIMMTTMVGEMLLREEVVCMKNGVSIYLSYLHFI